jgi:hypothetical protein
MKTISVKKDFNEINISNPLYVNVIIDQLKGHNFDKVNEIHLDLTGCITDYPDTPLLIDFFLNILIAKDGWKLLKITYTGIGTNELHVLYDIVLEGLFFRIKKESEEKNNLDNWIKIINDKLTSNNMSLIIECPFDIISYNYGK